jgi:VWFA-related protein
MRITQSRIAAVLLFGLWAQVAGAQETPRFTSTVEVLSVDVTVVDGRGRPITGLQPADFTVRVDNVPRKVLSAEWVALVGSPATPPSVPPLPQGYTSNEGTTAGRLIVFVIDQPNIRFGGMVSLRGTVNAFIDRLEPSDRVAVIGVGLGTASSAFTANRERAKQAVARMIGSRQMMEDSRFRLAVSEAVQVYRGNPSTLQEIVARECAGLEGRQLQFCIVSVENAAASTAVQLLADGRQTLASLRSLLTQLKTIDEAKTLVLLSEGFIVDDQSRVASELGLLATEAQTSIYALKLDTQGIDITQVEPSTAPFDDRRMMAEGLEALAGAARGSIFDVGPGAGPALERIEAEVSGYYLLGLESAPSDSSAMRHQVRIEVARRGATVRSRRELVGAAARGPDRTPQQVIADAVRSPLMLSALPIRVATFSLRDPDPAKVQLLLHAAVGAEYSAPRPVSIGYTITDADGRVVESQGLEAQLPPVLNGVPSPLQFRGGASVPPGDYTLKFAVAEGDVVGSIEHPIHAQLVPAGDVALSELLLGGPVPGRDPMVPTVGHTVSFGVLHGYMEAYGPDTDALRVKYEVARDVTSPAVLSAEVTGRPVGGGDRSIFAHLIPVRQLPAGNYVLRATVMPQGNAGPLKTLTRAFEVAPPAVLLTSAEGVGSPPTAPTELFLPVQDQLLERGFERAEVSRPEILQVFRERVGQAARAAFDRGVDSLAAGDYAKAESNFKSAIQVDTDSAAPLAYLAATFAASGRDAQAAGAWQTALIDGSDLPQIYVWLGDTLMRTRGLVEARAILEEAIGKWPTDARFVKPLALLYATFGMGREAVRTMARYLEREPGDGEALLLAVEWIYHLHTSGAVARTRAEDVKMARTYADAYEQAKGPRAALVKEWVNALEASVR